VRRSRRLVTIGAAALLLASACADEPATPEIGGDPDDPDENAADAVYDCFGVTATLQELEAAPSVADLEDHPAVPMFAEHADDLQAWKAVDVEDHELGAISELDPPQELDGEIRDHQRLVVTLLDEPMPPETDDEGWTVSSSGPCALRAELGDLGSAHVHLDGDAPDPDTTELDLLIVEHACASGADADGRVRVAVDATDEQVRLVVGVEPRTGDQACPSNPATPVTVALDEPIGDREVVDAGRYPPVELTTPPEDLPVAR
jgi:hypothetical protein